MGGEGFGVRLRNVSYWEINNLEITSGEHPTDMRRHGVLVVGEGTGAGNFMHIHIKNLDIHDIFGTDRRSGASISMPEARIQPPRAHGTAS
ncbi:hypothetical protein HMSSN139_37670 [Paenibacillus sp. HMSSN-139]|nr:hypothetical protein HMSSN139_37670 [Paenibacillus sp. HMSSN-139]